MVLETTPTQAATAPVALNKYRKMYNTGMFTKPTQPTELETYDNALHTLIADLQKMEDRQSRGIGLDNEKVLLHIAQQIRLVEHCQLAYEYILKRVVK